MITDLKLQGTSSLISVALLMGLNSQYVCTDLLHLLFDLCHNVGTKYGSLRTQTNSREYDRNVHKVPRMVTS
jgi:hypothetical protein